MRKKLKIIRVHCLQLWYHASLIVDLPITTENVCVNRIILKHDSKEKAALILFVSKRLSRLYC